MDNNSGPVIISGQTNASNIFTSGISQKTKNKTDDSRKRNRVFAVTCATFFLATIILGIVVYNVTRSRTEAEVAAYVDEKCLATDDLTDILACFDGIENDKSFSTENVVYGYNYAIDQLIAKGQTLNGAHMVISKASYEAVYMEDCGRAMRSYEEQDRDVFSMVDRAVLYSYAVGTAQFCEETQAEQFWMDKLADANEKVAEEGNDFVW